MWSWYTEKERLRFLSSCNTVCLSLVVRLSRGEGEGRERERGEGEGGREKSLLQQAESHQREHTNAITYTIQGLFQHIAFWGANR